MEKLLPLDSNLQINRELQDILDRGQRLISVTGLRGAAAAMLIAETAEAAKRPVLCVASTEQQAARVEQDLNLYTGLPVFLYPGYDIPPYTPLSPDSYTVAARISTLYRIMTAETPHILVAPAEALLRKVMPRDRLAGLAELIIAGEETDRDRLTGWLTAAGYEPVSLVQSIGEFSARGGILDIFPPPSTPMHSASGGPGDADLPGMPLRLDFFGDTVESIRCFDPITQRSAAELTEAVLLPVCDILFPPKDSGETEELMARIKRRAETLNWSEREADGIVEQIAAGRLFPGIEFFLPLFYPAPSSPLEYLPSDSLLFKIDPLALGRELNRTWEKITANYHEALASRSPALPPESLFLSVAELTKACDVLPQIELSDFPLQAPGQDQFSSLAISSGSHTLIKQALDLGRKNHGLLEPLVETISRWLADGDLVVFCCNSPRHAEHMANLLSRYDLPISTIDRPLPLSSLTRGEVLLTDRPLSEGFDLPGLRAHFLSESELFGNRRLMPGKKKLRGSRGKEVRFDELNIGDIVVHTTHGLGRYNGLINLNLNGIANDFLLLTYHGDDKLYVPVDRLNMVHKYKGLTEKQPKLDRLGSGAWARTKKKVKEEVWKVAMDLLDIYARREMETGHKFSRPAELYQELEESFPYDETSGQLRAINEVISDLTSEKVMDRLICGDVGYGKTEVAVRAAFKALEDNYQVAVLVPTTILAEQHAETFRERLTGFPVSVESLNRFRGRTEQKKILKGLADGTLDIVIGTHRLLSKDVKFRRLGLLIVDEEHRFGVSHKEKIKRLRARIDVLTLTATPIPRTLQMSLLGIRDLSVINSPPEHRRSVKTFVARYDNLVIKEAVSRELQRGGQVFIVHNRVRTIQEVAFTVQKLVPHARIAVAHGQMPVKNLEEIMVDFVRRQVDVLICTTIIESGLDIPNANTIIITRADRLGLAEIYQLRGRVGRSREQAYAYLLVPSMDGLSKQAQQRLRALMDYNELGGGFKLAMSDLQIRGGGNLLGVSQSGHIAAIGYDLYLDLLQKTVEDLKKKAADEDVKNELPEIEPEINLKISAYIPEHFIPDPNQRYIAYRKITSLTDREEFTDLHNELEDRYGPLPGETANLFEIMALKRDLKKLMIVKLEQGESALVFSFAREDAGTYERPAIIGDKILALINASGNRIRFTPDYKLIVRTNLDSPEAALSESKKVLHALGNE